MVGSWSIEKNINTLQSFKHICKNTRKHRNKAVCFHKNQQEEMCIISTHANTFQDGYLKIMKVYKLF